MSGVPDQFRTADLRSAADRKCIGPDRKQILREVVVKLPRDSAAFLVAKLDEALVEPPVLAARVFQRVCHLVELAVDSSELGRTKNPRANAFPATKRI